MRAAEALSVLAHVSMFVWIDQLFNVWCDDIARY